MELCELSAFDLSQLIRQGKASAVEAVDSALKRIAAVDGRPGSLETSPETDADSRHIHAFITLTAEKACTQARQIDAQIKEGKTQGLWQAFLLQ